MWRLCRLWIPREILIAHVSIAAAEEMLILPVGSLLHAVRLVVAIFAIQEAALRECINNITKKNLNRHYVCKQKSLYHSLSALWWISG